MLLTDRSLSFGLLTDRSLICPASTLPPFASPCRSCSPPAPADAGPPAPRPVLVQAAAPEAVKRQRSRAKSGHVTKPTWPSGSAAIVARLVDAGARVEQGTALARLDPPISNWPPAQARAQVASAESELATAEAEQGRYADLLAKRFVSRRPPTTPRIMPSAPPAPDSTRPWPRRR